MNFDNTEYKLSKKERTLLIKILNNRFNPDKCWFSTILKKCRNDKNWYKTILKEFPDDVLKNMVYNIEILNQTDAEQIEMFEKLADMQNEKDEKNETHGLAVLGKDIIAKYILINFGIKALSYVFKTQKWLRLHELEIIQYIFNERHATTENETWQSYTEGRDNFNEYPLLALKAFEIAKFFGNNYQFGEALFMENVTKNKFFRLRGQIHRTPEYTIYTIGVYTYGIQNLSEWYDLVLKAHEGFTEKLIVEYDIEEGYIYIRKHPRAIQMLVFSLLFNGYKLIKIQDMIQVSPEEPPNQHELIPKISKDKYKNIFSCISCGISADNGGKCETCSKTFCSLQCYSKEHTKGFCKK